jgi:hypothetical protein
MRAGRLVAVSALAGVALVTMSAVAAQQLPRAVGNETGTVEVRVVVTDVKGVPTADRLTADDFEVLSDGMPVEVRSASRAALPLRMIVLLDVSGSMHMRAHEDRFREAVVDVLEEHLQVHDHVQVSVFAREVELGPNLAPKRGSLDTVIRAALGALPDQRGGPSPIWDVLGTAVSALEPSQQSGAIILITDGESTGNSRSFQSVTQQATLAGISVSAIAQGLGSHLDARMRARGVAAPHNPAVYLRSLVRSTGGLYFSDGLDDRWDRPKPGPLLEATIQALRTPFRVRFQAPAADGRVHSQEVRVKRDGLVAHVRDRYRAAGP